MLLTTLGIPFVERKYSFMAYGQNQHFLEFSPTGLVPCLVDDDITVWDSLAIAEYVAEAHPSVWPADKRARAYARSAAAEMHSGFGHLRKVCSMSCRCECAGPQMSRNIFGSATGTVTRLARGDLGFTLTPSPLPFLQPAFP